MDMPITPGLKRPKCLARAWGPPLQLLRRSLSAAVQSRHLSVPLSVSVMESP